MNIIKLSLQAIGIVIIIAFETIFSYDCKSY